MCSYKEDMNIVIVGHVDHGKSTLIGRLLADTNSLPQGKLEQIRDTCRKNSKPFEYAFLLDALKDEQAQGITIDTARCFFKTKKRNYIIIDAPGHIEFLKNMVTGAARAEAAILLIDANEGISENSRRHGYMLSVLGVKKVIVAVNKLDLVDYSEEVFESIKTDYSDFLRKLNVSPVGYIPVSAFEGDNIVNKSTNMQWYSGETIIKAMDALSSEPPPIQQVFRMPVQDVYKFTKNNDNRRIIAGTIETGSIETGAHVVFYPSGKRSSVKSIESFPEKRNVSVYAGQAVGFTLNEQIYIKRGELMVIDGQDSPLVSSRIKVNIFWLGKNALRKNKRYIIKLGSEKTGFVIDEIIKVMNSSDLNTTIADVIECNEVAECIIKTEKPLALDLAEKLGNTSRFVIVDDYEIVGGGIALSEVRDEESDIQRKVILRNYKWEHSEISTEKRAEHYSQKPVLFILTGENKVGKKQLAKEFERSLVESGRFAYYLGIGTFLYGVDSDVKLQNDEAANHKAHIRRFAEVANLMLDAGMILIITARSLTANDLKVMSMIITADIQTIWVGKKITTDMNADIIIEDGWSLNTENILMFRELLKNKGYIFKG